MSKEHLKSEDFIWRDLIRYAQHAVTVVRAAWKKERDYPRVLIAWPSEHLHFESGRIIKNTISFAIPDEMSTKQAAAEMAQKTGAYALLLVEKRGQDLKIILESPHGARCWSLPVERHGDVLVLGKELASEDLDCIGVLWRPAMGPAS